MSIQDGPSVPGTRGNSTELPDAGSLSITLLLSDTRISLLESNARATRAAGIGACAIARARAGAIYSSRNYHTAAVRWSVQPHQQTEPCPAASATRCGHCGRAYFW